MKLSRQSYQQTEIGLLPEDWKFVRLGDPEIAKIRSNKSMRNFDKVAFIPMELVPDNEIYTKYEIKNCDEVKSATYCESGDLLLAKITPSLENGKQGIVPFNIPYKLALATTEVFPINCIGIDTHFTFYILKFPKYRNKLINSMIGTTGRQRASKSSVEKLIIPLPPLIEQKKIAEILSAVDEAIEKTNQAIKRTERLKSSLMKKLFSHGIDHNEFRTSEIGILPKEWNVLPLNKVITLCQYGLSTKISNEGRYKIVKMDNFFNGLVTPDNVKYANLDKKTFRNYVLQKEDILFNRTNSYELVGRTGIFLLDGDYVFASYLIRLRPNNSIVNSTFLTYYLIYSSQRLKKLATRAVHQANINAANLQRFKIPLPHLSEQKKIAEILNTVESRLEFFKKKGGKFERIKKGLMNDLLSGQIRVKV